MTPRETATTEPVADSSGQAVRAKPEARRAVGQDLQLQAWQWALVPDRRGNRLEWQMFDVAADKRSHRLMLRASPEIAPGAGLT